MLSESIADCGSLYNLLNVQLDSSSTLNVIWHSAVLTTRVRIYIYIYI
jgi:hypothetical protein